MGCRYGFGSFEHLCMCMILAAALDLYCLVLYFIRTTCLLAICALHADDVYLSKLPVSWQARNEYMLTRRLYSNTLRRYSARSRYWLICREQRKYRSPVNWNQMIWQSTSKLQSWTLPKRFSPIIFLSIF